VTKPSIGDLLSGVAASLRESVLPEIPAGPTRRQVQAAISIIRRVALVWDKTGPYLYADNNDIEKTLRQVSEILARAEADENGAGLELLRERLHAALDQRGEPVGEYPSPDALGARNVELQGLLVDVHETLHEPSKPKTPERIEILSILRLLLRRMLERELEVSLPSARGK
jgi:hypothetical protein